MTGLVGVVGAVGVAGGGCGSSSVHVATAGVGSTLPATSLAVTASLWAPSGRSVYDVGEVHGCAARPSSEQLKVALSEAVNVNVAVIDVSLAGGPDAIVVSGAIESTVHVRVAGLGSGFPAVSVAMTENVCGPSLSPE